MIARARSLPRFAARELLVWASLYFAYLGARSLSIDDAHEAIAHASSVVRLERATGLLHEADVQSAVAPALDGFSAYYMLGFGPLVAAVLVWLALRHRDHYRSLRTLLLVSLGFALIGYVTYPTAPPRLVPGLGLKDTVGLSGHDHGSVGGIRFDPYAAMPSMHVGWSLLVALVGFRAARSRLLKGFFVLHPLAMAVTVTATGNHYFVDELGGVGAALAAALVVAAGRRVRRRRVAEPAGATVIEFPGAPGERLAMPPIRRKDRTRRLAA